MRTVYPHKFISNSKGDVFCHYCGTIIKTADSNPLKQNRTLEGCPALKDLSVTALLKIMTTPLVQK